VENRLVLGLDNSIDFLNLALSLEDRLIEERRIRNTRAPSEIIALEVREMLSRHGYEPGNVGLIVTTLGPGSFTGIRVGLAFCKGFCAGAGTAVIGIPTLDVLAAPFAYMEGHYLCPVIDAKKGEVFTALYHVSDGDLEKVTGYCAIKPAQVTNLINIPCLLFGTGVSLIAPFVGKKDGISILSPEFSTISASILIKEGLRKSGLPLQPIYGRRSEAEIRFNIEMV
jgi:tRNA threonylcarbamoyladenosine biosynthesis protein TsaB